jgi:hypothetical protein
MFATIEGGRFEVSGRQGPHREGKPFARPVQVDLNGTPASHFSRPSRTLNGPVSPTAST